MARRRRVSRRHFVKLGVAAGAGLAIGYPLVLLLDKGSTPPGTDLDRDLDLDPLAGDPALWLKIGRDDRVTVVVPRCEMGQGVTTALPMIVAEELEADWSTIDTAWAPLDPRYGRQLTGASDSVRTLWEPLRQAGALARDMLILAAARQWRVDRRECRAERGAVIHTPSGRSARYGALADAAAGLPLPRQIRLKRPSDFRLIGTATPRRDLPDKVTGRAVYGLDVSLPGMLVAAVVHCPAHRGRVRSVDATDARALPGVRDIICLDADDRSGCAAVAVAADSFWAAQRAARALRVTWQGGPYEGATSRSIAESFRRLAEQDGKRIVDRGESERVLADAARRVEAAYDTPYLAHAAMEPMTCAAAVDRSRCDVWVATQLPTLAREVAARTAGLPIEAVTIHQMYVGGGFGRRQRADVVAEAVQIAKAVGRPVKVVWSREEEIQHGYYRPATYHQLRAGLDGDGALIAWTHRIVGIGGSDTILVQGVDEIPYEVPNKHISLVRQARGPVQTGPWRGLARSQNTFVTECFIDEIAHAAGRDPLAVRRALLAGAPRHRAVLEAAADKAGWRRPAPGRHQGLALSENFGGICAQVAEVSAADAGSIRVHRVVCAIDCGRIVNPDIVIAQMEGGIVFGLSAALKEAITIADGRVEQSNFHDYEVLRMREVPEIEVHLITSDEPPGGVGETAVPAVAPAVANAVFAATGTRWRRLPITRT